MSCGSVGCLERSIIEVRSAPMWGTTKAMDQEYMPSQPSGKLALGQHQVDVTVVFLYLVVAGVLLGSYGSFTIPFGWVLFVR